MRQARDLLPNARHIPQKTVRALLDELVDDEVLDYEQPRTETKIYFLIGFPPRCYVVSVAAPAAPEIKLGHLKAKVAARGMLQ